VSRAPDGTPLHIRADGPGLDSMDVPAFRTFPGPAGVQVPPGSQQFKLQFLVYVPTADLFARMRAAQAAPQLQRQFMNGEGDDNGLERFITATRRQNFLIPPRRHRAFPLVELAGPGTPGHRARRAARPGQVRDGGDPAGHPDGGQPGSGRSGGGRSGSGPGGGRHGDGRADPAVR
jgi:hypothetical protein